MSRFVSAVAVPPPWLGTGLVLNAKTGLYDVDGIAPQPLSGAILGSDYVLISRNIGTTAAPNFMPYYASPAQVQALAGSSSSGSTTPTSTAFASPLTFAGAAGALSGNQVLTAFPGSGAVGTASRDGSGNFLPPTAAYQYGMLEAAGSFSSSAVSKISAVFASGAQGPITIGYMDAAGQNGGFVVFGQNGPSLTILATLINGALTTANGPTFNLAGHTSVGMKRNSDSSWQAHIDSTIQTGFAFNPPVVEAAYVLIGAGDIANSATAISQITVQ